MLEQGYSLLALAGSSIALVAIIAHAIARQSDPKRVPVRVRRNHHRR
jgi:hypothetical protein